MIIMDKLGAYECTACKGQLIEMSNDPLPNGKMMSHFQCMKCFASHAYIEEPYIHPPERTPEFKCRFCQQQCTYYSLADAWQDYWICQKCKVHYTKWLKGIEAIGESYQMYTRLREHTYCLRQYTTENKSRLELIPDDPEETMVVVKDFDFLFPDVTPDNIQDKLSIYILFS